MVLKSAYSECVTRNGKIEYNLVAVTSRITLVFAKDTSLNNAISTDHIQVML